MSITDITVVITSFKSGKKIKNCLNSIDRQSKVIIVENSNDIAIKKNIEKHHEISWNIMEYHEISWNIMKYREISWNIFKCRQK